jgi:hypothetical protein
MKRTAELRTKALIRFLAEESVLTDISVCDRGVFRWTERDIPEAFTLPLYYYDISESRYFLITGFNSVSPVAVKSAAENREQALHLSLTAYGELSLIEWAMFRRLINGFGINFKEFCEEHRSQYNDITPPEEIERLSGLPDEILAYLQEKRIAFSTLSLALKVWERYPVVFIDAARKKLTAQSFRKFLEDTLDFAGSPKDRRSNGHILIDEAAGNISAAVFPVSVHNPDNYETDALKVTFTAENFAEFSHALNRLSEALPLIEKFYREIKRSP